MQRRPTDDRDRTTESKFYIPAGADPSSETDRLGRLWAALFDHQLDT
jgi:hypothetical protein